MSIQEELKERARKCLGVAGTPKSNARMAELKKWLADHVAPTVGSIALQHIGPFLQLIKQWEDEDAKMERVSPIRSVMKQELVPGNYGYVIVADVANDAGVPLQLSVARMNADDMRRTATTLIEIADFLDPAKDELE